MDSINIVFACDHKFAFPMTVSAYSALSNLTENRNANLFIIYAGINEKTRNKIEKVLKKTKHLNSIKWIENDLKSVQNLATTEDINQTTYLRILIPELIPQIDKVIYLDSDIIVKGNLANLWDEDMEGQPMGGVQDFFFHTISANNAILNHKDLSLKDDTVFCNAGVLVMNLKWWRENGVAKKIIAFVKETQQNDQQGINAIVAGRWKLYDPLWNVTLSSLDYFNKNNNSLYKKDYSLLLTDAKIIHYTSKYKPWHYGWHHEALTVNYYSQNERTIYFDYVKKSRWFNAISFNFWVSVRKSILFFGKKVPHQVKNIISK